MKGGADMEKLQWVKLKVDGQEVVCTAPFARFIETEPVAKQLVSRLLKEEPREIIAKLLCEVLSLRQRIAHKEIEPVKDYVQTLGKITDVAARVTVLEALKIAFEATALRKGNRLEIGHGKQKVELEYGQLLRLLDKEAARILWRGALSLGPDGNPRKVWQILAEPAEGEPPDEGDGPPGPAMKPEDVRNLISW